VYKPIQEKTPFNETLHVDPQSEYGMSKYLSERLIEFYSKKKMNDLKIIRKIYENKYDKRNIENEITELAQKPITRREIVLALKSNYDKTGLVIRKLAKEGKINVINKKPLTIISLKEAPHDSLRNHP